jgi:hypothetical protein
VSAREDDPHDAIPFTKNNALPNVRELNVPTVPEVYVVPEVKASQGEPEWNVADNPGNWNRYCFQSSFNKQKQCVHHKLPTGVTPVPEADDCRKSNGWVFVYKNRKLDDSWKRDGPFADVIGAVEDVPSYRSGATTSGLFPSMTIVKKAGVNAEAATYSSTYYTTVHVSMQSTSSTNFSSVNALNAVTNYIQVRERGNEVRGTKRSWGIEMNEARELYLGTYGCVDTVDGQIRR